MRALSIRNKLIGAFALLALLVAALGATALTGLATIEHRVVDLGSSWLPKVRVVEEMGIYSARHGLNVYRHLAAKDDAEMHAIEVDVGDRAEHVGRLIEAYRSRVASPEDGALFDRFVAQWQAYLREVEPVIALSRRNENDAARSLMESTALPTRLAMVKTLDGLIALTESGSAAAIADAGSDLRPDTDRGAGLRRCRRPDRPDPRLRHRSRHLGRHRIGGAADDRARRRRPPGRDPASGREYRDRRHRRRGPGLQGRPDPHEAPGRRDGRGPRRRRGAAEAGDARHGRRFRGGDRRHHRHGRLGRHGIAGHSPDDAGHRDRDGEPIDNGRRRRRGGGLERRNGGRSGRGTRLLRPGDRAPGPGFGQPRARPRCGNRSTPPCSSATSAPPPRGSATWSR